MATQLPPLNKVERLSPLVIRILGGNPGKFTLQGTNTYLIGKGASRILLDTGEGKEEWQSTLKEVLASEKATVEKTLLSHWHLDHISGISDILELCPDTAIFKNQPALHGDEDLWKNIENGDEFTTEGASLRAVHCPGHTKDHMAFVLREEDAMFTGDNVLGHGPAVFEDLAAYMDSLEKMGGEFSGRAYPGHGDLLQSGKAKIQEYIAHRQERERQVLDVLSSNNPGRSGDKSWSSMEIVKLVYKDVPEDLHKPAEGGVLQVLAKLKKDGKSS